MDQAENLRNIIKKDRQLVCNTRVITVTSGKGGVGKSNVSVNLAIQLKKLGNRVIIIDADFGLANVEVMFGIRPTYNLGDLIYRGKDIKDIIIKGPEGIGFISGGSGIQELSNLNRDQIATLTRSFGELDKITDVIIVDTGAGINESILEFVTSSSEVLLVVTPEPTSITDAYALLKTLDGNDEFNEKNTIIKVITNRVSSKNDGKELFHKLNAVVQKFLDIQLEYLGAIPQDNNVSKAVILQKPFSLVYPASSSSRAIRELAYTLYHNEVPNKTGQNKGMSRFFANLIEKARQRQP